MNHDGRQVMPAKFLSYLAPALMLLPIATAVFTRHAFAVECVTVKYRVGLITEFEQAEAIVGTGDADLIALARTILFNPRWPWHAAAHFGAQVKSPDQVSEIATSPISRPFRHRALISSAT